MSTEQFLEFADVDWGDGTDLIGVGGIRPQEGLHHFRITFSDLVASKGDPSKGIPGGKPQQHVRAVVVRTLKGVDSVGKEAEEWLSLPNAAQEEDKRKFTRGVMNRWNLGIYGQAVVKPHMLRADFQGYVGREFVAYYFPFVRAEDNNGAELRSSLQIQLMAAPQKDGTTVNEIQECLDGKRTPQRPKAKPAATTAAPGYATALAGLAGPQNVTGVGLPGGLPAVPGMPGFTPTGTVLPVGTTLPAGTALPTGMPGTGTGFQSAPAAFPGVPANSASAPGGLPPMPH